MMWLASGESCDGKPILYRLTRDRDCGDCRDCLLGECVQRVEHCDAWTSDVVIHGQQRSGANGLN